VCRTHVWMIHIAHSHTHMYEWVTHAHVHTYECVMSHSVYAMHTSEWVTSHIYTLECVAHTYEWFISHIRTHICTNGSRTHMCTHMSVSCHTVFMQCTQVNESRHTYTHLSVSHTRMNDSYRTFAHYVTWPIHSCAFVCTHLIVSHTHSNDAWRRFTLTNGSRTYMCTHMNHSYHTFTHTNVLHTRVCAHMNESCHTVSMGWLRLVGSLKLYVSSAEYRLFYKALL